MASLVVRDIDEDIVKALKASAGKVGISAEALHRKILESALIKPKKRNFADALKSIPDVGCDEDFARIQKEKASDVFN